MLLRPRRPLVYPTEHLMCEITGLVGAIDEEIIDGQHETARHLVRLLVMEAQNLITALEEEVIVKA